MSWTRMSNPVICVETNAPNPLRLPRWRRRAFVDTGTDTVFLPTMATNTKPSELQLTLCANFDGIATVLDSRHVYFPADWLAGERPAWADDIRAIARSVLAHTKKQGA
jgi:hypothetical protein